MKKIAHLGDEKSRNERLRNFELVAVMGAGNGFLPVYSAFVMAAILIIYPAVSHVTAAIWATTYLVYTATRTIATSLYNEDIDRTHPQRVKYWRRFVFLSALTHGIILGSLAVIALPALNPARQLVLTCFVLLITTGAVLYVSAILPALLALITVALLPFAFAWEYQRSTFEMPVAWFLFAAWILNLFMSWIHHRAGSRFFLLAADNEALAIAMEQKNRELQAADQARVQLLAITSHDLRQPVHALRLILAHVNEFDDPRILRQHIDKLREVSNLIAQMLLELMDLSTLEQRDNVQRLEVVSLTKILHQLKTSQEPLAKRKGLSFSIQECGEIWVQADTNLLRRMLLNLLSNAIKYTSVGGVRVECNVQHDHVVISVCDSGIGIPTARLDDIFRPYVRLDPLIADKDGVGLGLAIVHRAAVVQGFEIHVASTLGVGSIFELNVPLIDKPPDPPDFEQSQSSVESFSNALIAVVDDDFFSREALVALLKRWGYVTVSGESLSDLQKALDGRPKPALIIADNHLSSIEFGPDVILEIRKRFKDPSIAGVVMTGDTDVMLDGLPHVKLVHKPLDPDFLRVLVLRMMSDSTMAKHEE